MRCLLLSLCVHHVRGIFFCSFVRPSPFSLVYVCMLASLFGLDLMMYTRDSSICFLLPVSAPFAASSSFSFASFLPHLPACPVLFPARLDLPCTAYTTISFVVVVVHLPWFGSLGGGCGHTPRSLSLSSCSFGSVGVILSSLSLYIVVSRLCFSLLLVVRKSQMNCIPFLACSLPAVSLLCVSLGYRPPPRQKGGEEKSPRGGCLCYSPVVPNPQGRSVSLFLSHAQP